MGSAPPTGTHRSVTPKSIPLSELGNNGMLMLLEKVSIFNPTNPGKQKTISAFFDPGSQKTYLDTAIARQLQLSTGDRTNISLSSFGRTTVSK